MRCGHRRAPAAGESTPDAAGAANPSTGRHRWPARRWRQIWAWGLTVLMVGAAAGCVWAVAGGEEFAFAAALLASGFLLACVLRVLGAPIIEAAIIGGEEARRLCESLREDLTRWLAVVSFATAATVAYASRLDAAAQAVAAHTLVAVVVAALAAVPVVTLDNARRRRGRVSGGQTAVEDAAPRRHSHDETAVPPAASDCGRAATGEPSPRPAAAATVNASSRARRAIPAAASVAAALTAAALMATAARRVLVRRRGR